MRGASAWKANDLGKLRPVMYTSFAVRGERTRGEQLHIHDSAVWDLGALFFLFFSFEQLLFWSAILSDTHLGQTPSLNF
jgi:hypothetical protein